MLLELSIWSKVLQSVQQFSREIKVKKNYFFVGHSIGNNKTQIQSLQYYRVITWPNDFRSKIGF